MNYIRRVVWKNSVFEYFLWKTGFITIWDVLQFSWSLDVKLIEVEGLFFAGNMSIVGDNM